MPGPGTPAVAGATIGTLLFHARRGARASRLSSPRITALTHPPLHATSAQLAGPTQHDAVLARAPARLDFGGGWTDVPPYTTEQGGCVCNLAIARYASARLVADASGPTSDDALGAAAMRRSLVRDARLEISSDFPFGAGLGGSSAAGVALAAALATWKGESVTRAELAERSRATEVEELGVAGGRQDHYAAAFGGALGLWFDDEVRAKPITLPPAMIESLERRCVVAFTGESRISGETITAVLDAYRARAPRVTSALARMKALAQQMILALEREQIDELAALVGEHWAHQRTLHDRITTPTIDAVMREATRAGALGGKALGASGGGCVVVIAPDDGAEAVRRAVSSVCQVLDFTIDLEGVHVE